MGKTVLLNEAAEAFRHRDGWVVVEPNPNRDLLVSLAAKPSSETGLAQSFKKARINLSFFGLGGLEVDDVAPITDIEAVLSQMLESLARPGKRVLVEIDEVSNTPTMREFASSFQIFVRQGLPVFLLATGLSASAQLPRTAKGPLSFSAPTSRRGS